MRVQTIIKFYPLLVGISGVTNPSAATVLVFFHITLCIYSTHKNKCVLYCLRYQPCSSDSPFDNKMSVLAQNLLLMCGVAPTLSNCRKGGRDFVALQIKQVIMFTWKQNIYFLWGQYFKSLTHNCNYWMMLVKNVYREASLVGIGELYSVPQVHAGTQPWPNYPSLHTTQRYNCQLLTTSLQIDILL